MKPIKWGFKMWVLTSSEGVLHHILPAQGGQTKLIDAKYGLGPDVVLTAVDRAALAPGSRVTFDNLFTTLPLIKQLSLWGIGGIGTVRQNQLHKIPLPDVKEVDRDYQRGQYETVYSGGVSITVWKDNKPVYMMSNMHAARPGSRQEGQAERFSKADGGKINIAQPDSISHYNKTMGGVDLLDQMIGRYPPSLHSRKWWLRVFHQCLQIQQNQGWRFLQQLRGNKMQFRDFLMEFIHAVVQVGRIFNCNIYCKNKLSSA